MESTQTATQDISAPKSFTKGGNRYTIIKEAKAEYQRQKLSSDFSTFLENFRKERKKQISQKADEKYSPKRRLKRLPIPKKRVTLKECKPFIPPVLIPDPIIRTPRRSFKKLYEESTKAMSFEDFKKTQKKKFTQEKNSLYYKNNKARKINEKLNRAFQELEHAKLFAKLKRTALSGSAPTYTVNSTMNRINYILSNPSNRSKKYKIKKKEYSAKRVIRNSNRKKAVQLRSLYSQIDQYDYREDYKDYRLLFLKQFKKQNSSIRREVNKVIAYKQETKSPISLTKLALRLGIIHEIYPFHLYDDFGNRKDDRINYIPV